MKELLERLWLLFVNFIRAIVNRPVISTPLLTAAANGREELNETVVTDLTINEFIPEPVVSYDTLKAAFFVDINIRIAQEIKEFLMLVPNDLTIINDDYFAVIPPHYSSTHFDALFGQIKIVAYSSDLSLVQTLKEKILKPLCQENVTDFIVNMFRFDELDKPHMDVRSFLYLETIVDYVKRLPSMEKELF